jgi:hypothetical protein
MSVLLAGYVAVDTMLVRTQFGEHPRSSGRMSLLTLIAPRKQTERPVESTEKLIPLAVIASRVRKSLSDIAFCQIASWAVSDSKLDVNSICQRRSV